MTLSPRLAVERVTPPKAPYRRGIRINVEGAPTRDELVEAARRDGVSLVYLDVPGAAR